jgi:phage terminase large subunit
MTLAKNAITVADQEKILTKARTDSRWFVNTFILDPFNSATGENYFITRQQSEGLEILEKLVNGKRNGEFQDILGLSIMSGKGTGKDAFTVWAMLWFMFCYPYPKVPCISISSDQLDKVLWSEISKWLAHSLVKDYFVLQNDKLFRKDVAEDVRGKQWFAFKKAANPKSTPTEQVETLQGLHAEYLMQIVDEGSGVLNPVYEALEHNQTGMCNFMLLIFNPMHAKGYAVETQYKRKNRWFTLRWNAEESEIVNQADIKRTEEDFGGKESNVYRMNVLGLPPHVDVNALIDWEWALTAVDRPITVLDNMNLIKAVDCGAGGDKSIIASRRGNKVYPFKRSNTSDSIELANWIGNDIDSENPDCVRVDTIGIGWAVEGMLREKKGSIIEAADVRRQSDEPERFSNKRSEMYFRLREKFEKGIISIPNDSELLNQIAATKYEISNSGQIKIIEKKKIKRETGHSPDELDALAMTYFYDDTMTSTFKRILVEEDEPIGSWMCA